MNIHNPRIGLWRADRRGGEGTRAWPVRSAESTLEVGVVTQDTVGSAS